MRVSGNPSTLRNVPLPRFSYNSQAANSVAGKFSGPPALTRKTSSNPSLLKSPQATPAPMSSGNCDVRVPLKVRNESRPAWWVTSTKFGRGASLGRFRARLVLISSNFSSGRYVFGRLRSYSTHPIAHPRMLRTPRIPRVQRKRRRRGLKPRLKGDLESAESLAGEAPTLTGVFTGGPDDFRLIFT